MNEAGNDPHPAPTTQTPQSSTNYRRTDSTLKELLMPRNPEPIQSSLQNEANQFNWTLASQDARRFRETLKENQNEKLANRPRQTQRAYDSRQRIWREWCQKQNFEDKDLVTPGKTLQFLRNYIIPRGNTKERLQNGKYSQTSAELNVAR